MQKMYQESTSKKSHEKYDIFNLIAFLWNYKFKIIFTGSITLLASLIFLSFIPNQYKSSALIFVDGEDSGGFSSLANQYSSLQSIIPVSLPSGFSNNNDERIIEVIKSRKFIKILVDRYDILPELYASHSYDNQSKTLNYDKNLYDINNKKWTKNKKNLSNKPSHEEIYHKYINDIIEVSKDTQTGFIHLSVTHESPIFAKKFVDLIKNEINTIFREKDQSQNEMAIEYLTNLLKDVSVQDIKKSINFILTKKVEQKMLTDIKEDYVIQYIDPPFYPEDVFFPNRILLALLISIVTMMTYSFFIVLKNNTLQKI